MVASGAHAMAASITRRGAIAAQLALAGAVLCPWITRAEVALPPRHELATSMEEARAASRALSK